MQLALSLNANNIINFEEAPSEWRKVFPHSDDVLALPGRLGLDGVEIKALYRDADALDTLLSRFCPTGVQLTFHKEIYFPGHSRSFLGEYHSFISTCQRHGIYNPLVVIHGTEGKNLYPIEHRQATVESINILTAEFPQIRFAVEVNRQRRTLYQACQSYEDAMAILRRCRSKAVGVCWDLGHCHYNSLYWDMPFIPPLDFLKRVINVHVHDVVGEETHHFLHPGGLPLEDALDALRGVDYDGPLTLEVSPERTKAGKNFISQLEKMVGEVRELAVAPAYSAVV